MPSGTEVSTAAQMMAPSMKLWNASPKNHERRRRRVHLALVGVAMAEQDELLEHEEHQDAGEQRAEDRRRRERA